MQLKLSTSVYRAACFSSWVKIFCSFFTFSPKSSLTAQQHGDALQRPLHGATVLQSPEQDPPLSGRDNSTHTFKHRVVCVYSTRVICVNQWSLSTAMRPRKVSGNLNSDSDGDSSNSSNNEIPSARTLRGVLTVFKEKRLWLQFVARLRTKQRFVLQGQFVSGMNSNLLKT